MFIVFDLFTDYQWNSYLMDYADDPDPSRNMKILWGFPRWFPVGLIFVLAAKAIGFLYAVNTIYVREWIFFLSIVFLSVPLKAICSFCIICIVDMIEVDVMFYLSLSGFIIIPVSGYIMWVSL